MAKETIKMISLLPVETERTTIRPLQLSDAPFIVALLNDPGFLRNVGDRGVRTVEDGEKYIREVQLASYEQHGLGSFAVILKPPATADAQGEDATKTAEDSAAGIPIGICGLLSRPWLDGPDVGFCFLEAYCGMGFGFETGRFVVENLCPQIALHTIWAIVSPHNAPSHRLLKKLSFLPQGQISPFGEVIDLYRYQREAPPP